MPNSREADWRHRTADGLFAVSAAIFAAAAIVVLAVPSRAGAAADVLAFAATWSFLLAMPILLFVQLAILRGSGAPLLRRLGLALLVVWGGTVAYLGTVVLA